MMADRISSMRVGLRERLERLRTPGSWSHITNQVGMVSFSGLTRNDMKIMQNFFYFFSNRFFFVSIITAQAAELMVAQHHIYLLTKGEMCGRINFAALNTKNIDNVANCIHLAITTCKQ